MISGRPVRILLAEDNPADVYLLQQAFDNELDLTVYLTVFRDGESAVDYVRSSAADADIQLFILDLNLPKKDGGDVLKEIRSRDELSRIPVVVLTSSDSPRDRALARNFGADHYFIKPSDLDDFFALSRTLLDLAATSPARG